MVANLTDEQLEVIAKAVLKEQKKQEHQKEAKTKDWRLRNTKMLLKNYHILQKHCVEIVEDLEAFEEIIFDPEELNLKALMRYKAKTKKMLDYFDSSWGSYQNYSKLKGGSNVRRCDVLYKVYLSPIGLKKTDVAELYDIDERTIRRDEKKAIEELSIFLFGIDSLSDLEQLIL